jgi:hypothetical protein
VETVIVGDKRIVIPPEIRVAGDEAVLAYLDAQTTPPRKTTPKTTAAPAEGA